MFENGFFGNVLSKNNTDAASDFLTGSSSSGLSTIKASEFILCVAAALIIGFLISVIYMITHKKEGFAQSYVLTIIMLPAIVTLILLLINTTYGALSLAGAFTLVRFRSVPGDPKDITYVFFTMAIGVACGMGYIGFAIVFFVIMGIVVIALNLADFGGCKVNHMTLKITIPENLNYKGVFDEILKKYTGYYKLRRIKTTNFGTLFELIYSVDIYDDTDTKKFIDELRALNGNLNINLVFFKYDDKVYES